MAMTGNKADRIGTVLIVLGCVMIFLCAALIAHNTMEDINARAAAMEDMKKVREAISERSKVLTENEEYSETALVGTAVYGPQKTEPEELPEMSVAEIDGFDYIGYLSFRGLDTELPVLADCSLDLLKKAPCLYSGSYYTDDLVICAHNYKSSFGKLKKLVQGDEIYFTDMDGKVHGYKVADVEILDPEDIPEMVDSGWPLSLYTCTYDGSQRLTVRAEKIEQN